jgi:hypothetical protein
MKIFNFKLLLLVIICIFLFVGNNLNIDLKKDNILWSKRADQITPYNLLETEFVSSNNTIIKNINNSNKI